MLEWALRYIHLGWPVIPLWPFDKLGAPSKDYPRGVPLGKHPLGELVPHGSKDASLNEGLIRHWWSKWPDANVGLATSHGWFAVDVDTKGGGEETWDTLRLQHQAGPMPAQTNLRDLFSGAGAVLINLLIERWLSSWPTQKLLLIMVSVLPAPLVASALVTFVYLRRL